MIIVLLVLLAALIGYASYKDNAAFALTRVTILPADVIIERVVGRYTVNGWQVPSQTDRSVTMYRRGAPGCLPALLLLMLGIVPGLLYLLLGDRDNTIAVTTRLQSDGRIEVEVIGNRRGDGGLSIARSVLDALP